MRRAIKLYENIRNTETLKNVIVIFNKRILSDKVVTYNIIQRNNIPRLYFRAKTALYLLGIYPCFHNFESCFRPLGFPYKNLLLLFEIFLYTKSLHNLLIILFDPQTFIIQQTK